MRSLPLYLGQRAPEAAAQSTSRLPPDKSCQRCELAQGARAVCIGADGEPGGLLILGDAPTRAEDLAGRPFTGDSGTYVRRLVAKLWQGPVVYDYAVKCAPGRTKLGDKHLDACRPYLAGVLADAAPKRVILLNGQAAAGLLGRSVAVWSARGGYAYLAPPEDAIPSAAVPVFFMLPPYGAMRNRFVRGAFEADMERAINGPLPPRPPWHARFTEVTSQPDAIVMDAVLRRAPWVAWDVETAGQMHDPSFRIVSIAFAPADDPDGAWYVGREALANPHVLHIVKAVLTNPAIPKVGQNVKYDATSVRVAWGVWVQGFRGDTRLWRKLLDVEADAKLDTMAELVGMGGTKEEAAEAKGVELKRVRGVLAAERRGVAKGVPIAIQGDSVEALETCIRLRADHEPIHPLADPSLEAFIRLGAESDAYVYGLLPDDVLGRYNARDAVATARLATHLEAQLNEVPQVRRVWDRVVCSASVAVEKMEHWGVAVSKDAIVAFDHFLEGEVAGVKRRLDAYDPKMNWESGAQIADFLFGRLKLPVLKKTPGGQPSTDAQALAALSGKHSAVADILAFRKLVKMRGTYAGRSGLDGMFAHIRADGRIHPTILLDGARSGRTSCSNPNLQNIPRANKPLGKMARDIFVAPAKNRVLFEADFKQLEIYVAAALSGDPDMLAIIRAGVDYHQTTAELVSQIAWGIPPEKVTSEHRSAAKIINFGLIYGMGDASLAAKIGCSVAMAARIREAILGKFKRLAAWIRERLAETRRTGDTWTYWDGEPARRRQLWGIASPDDEERSNAENGSFNTPVQGTANDFCEASLAMICDWLEADRLDAMLCLSVHDSVILEINREDLHEVAHQVSRIMTSHNGMGINMAVDMKWGSSWGSLVEYTESAA